ncbi:MAG: ABC transporter permease [Bacteroidota bacterium]|nr:ABC transporter permease [Bacteroidota bacterium]MDP4226702.1 ABC transporter permease [Bacteroidota bacterium]MDP4274895.1 ABC transporter permease [Bacteroidota bacterium]
MNTELFIAKRLISDKDSRHHLSMRIVRIAVFGIALGLSVMIIAVAIVTGFKKQISDKVIGFGSHIQIINYDSNNSYETKPIDKTAVPLRVVKSIDGIQHIQAFATKAGIIKTENQIQGVALKGIDSNFDWTFFKKSLVEGDIFRVTDNVTTSKVLISKYLSSLLQLKTGDEFAMYFIQDPPRMRRFKISGVYETSMMDFDKVYILTDIKHIQKLNGWNPNQISGYEIYVDDYRKIDQVDEQVKKVVGNSFTSDGSRLKVITIKEKYPQIFDWINLQDLNTWIILILMLLVAGFNMVSGLLIIILERTKMIGILKALGSENISIRRIFLYESGFLISRGLLWGNVIGIILCLIQMHFHLIKLDASSYFISTVPINLNLLNMVILNIGTLAITILMLVIPSFVVSRISPVKTIRFD